MKRLLSISILCLIVFLFASCVKNTDDNLETTSVMTTYSESDTVSDTSFETIDVTTVNESETNKENTTDTVETAQESLTEATSEAACENSTEAVTETSDNDELEFRVEDNKLLWRHHGDDSWNLVCDFNDVYTKCEHNFDITVVTESTCTQSGLAVLTCNKCGDSYSCNLPLKEHAYDNQLIDDEYLSYTDDVQHKSYYYCSCECCKTGDTLFEYDFSQLYDEIDNIQTLDYSEFSYLTLDISKLTDYIKDNLVTSKTNISNIQEIENHIFEITASFDNLTEKCNIYIEDYPVPTKFKTDADNVKTINEALEKHGHFASEDDFITYLKKEKLNFETISDDCRIVFDLSGNLAVLVNKESSLSIYPHFDDEIKYLEYSYLESVTETDITPESFKINSAYSIQNLTTAQYQGSSYFETAYLNISKYKGCEIVFLLPVYRTLSGGQCPYGNFTSKTSEMKIEKGWLVVNPGTAERTYQLESFGVGEDDNYLYICKLMDGVENYNYMDEYKLIVRDKEYRTYYFKFDKMSDNYILYNHDEVSDYYSIGSMGDAVSDQCFSCTSYIDCNNAIGLELSVVSCPDKKYCSFYDKDKHLIYSVNSVLSDTYGKATVYLEIPSDAYYFRASYYDFDQSREFGDFECKVFYEEGYDIPKYRSNINQAVYFSQRINQNISYYEDSDYIDSPDDYKQTTGVLLLPDSYSITGEKTKLIIYVHGYSHYVYNGAWGSTDNFYKQKEYYISQGFAIMDCNGARDDNKQMHFTSCGTPQFVEGYHKCVEYITEHYNIDDDVYVIGGSAGGLASINYTYKYQDNVRALTLISTWASGEKHAWGQGCRDCYVEYFGFKNTSTYESEKVGMYDPARHIVDDMITDLYIPIRITYGETEKSSEFINYLINTYYSALLNGGTNVEIEEIAGYGHNIVSGNIVESDSKIVEFFNKY